MKQQFQQFIDSHCPGAAVGDVAVGYYAGMSDTELVSYCKARMRPAGHGVARACSSPGTGSLDSDDPASMWQARVIEAMRGGLSETFARMAVAKQYPRLRKQLVIAANKAAARKKAATNHLATFKSALRKETR